MNLILPVTAAAVLPMTVAFVTIVARLLRARRADPVDIEWCRNFSTARYRPMERLFVEEDYEFLSAQPGFSPALYRRLQAERRRVFRQYLKALGHDFDRLMAAAKMLIVHAAEDRPDLSKLLVRQKLVFTYALATVHCRLVLSELGLGRVDVRPLVRALDGLRMELGSLSASVRVAA